MAVIIMIEYQMNIIILLSSLIRLTIIYATFAKSWQRLGSLLVNMNVLCHMNNTILRILQYLMLIFDLIILHLF